MKTIKLVAAGVLAGLATTAFGKTWYVNCRAANASDANPGTETEPFKTINAASTNVAFTAGDTILVAPGVYNEGWARPTYSGNVTTNRVYLPKKTILRASGPRDETFIVGKLHGGKLGFSTANIRCILVDGRESVIEGFTICNGGTESKYGNSNCSGAGGGVSVKPKSPTSSMLTFNNIYRDVYVVDCVISNCVATQGAALYGATAVRCTLRNGYTYNRGDHGGMAFCSALFGCVIEGMHSSGNSFNVVHNCYSVNCTFFNCRGSSSANIVYFGKAYNCVFCANTFKSGYEFNNASVTDCTTTTANGDYQLVGPGRNDYRLVVGSGGDAIACDARAWETLGISSAYTTKDFAGNDFPSSGTCLPGAVQGTGVVKGGMLAASGSNLIVEGDVLRAGGYIQAEAWPTQWCVTAVPPAGSRLWAFERTGVYDRHVYPLTNDVAYITALPTPRTSTTTLTPTFASVAYWVSPTGSDDNPGTEAEPFATLQAAADKCGTSPTIIYAAPGDYATGGRAIGSGIMNRLAFTNANAKVLVRGAGAGRSFITGAADPDTGGCGPNAVRPVAAAGSTVAIQGFTLRGGYSAASGDFGAVLGASGAYAKEQSVFSILDCEITGCTGSAGVAAYASLRRCRVTGNTSENSLVASNTRLASCVVADNVVGSGVSLFAGATLVNCTVEGVATSPFFASTDGRAYACILDTGAALASANSIHASLVWRAAQGTLQDDYWLSGDPIFVDAGGGDYRTYSLSPAHHAVTELTPTKLSSDWHKYMTADVEGRRFVWRDAAILGAHSESVPANGVYAHAANGGLSADGFTPLADEATLALTRGAATRPCIGYTVNGVTNLFDETPSRIFTASDSAYIEAIYGTAWYVDANGGDDVANYGFTPENPRQSFKALIEGRTFLEGDVIHAAAGHYASGEMAIPSSTVRARVTLPQNVTLVADEGPEATFIHGAAATVSPVNGCGSDAVRCVYMNSYSAVKGFTLTGGHSHSTDNTHGYGGAVAVSSSDSPTSYNVEDCIISNNVARRGSVANAQVVRCRFFENSGSHPTGVDATGIYGGRAYGCLFARNANGNYLLLYPDVVANCTLAADNGSKAFLHVGSKSPVVLNSIVPGGLYRGTGTLKNAVHSIFTSAAATNDLFLASVEDGNLVTNVSALVFDAAYRPVVGSNPAVDAGVTETASATILDNPDVSGAQRVYNGAIDVGALEADWRPVYAKDVAKGRWFTVTAATSNVVESVDRTVLVPPGQSLSATCRNATGHAVPYVVSFRVTGTGTLTLTVNDEETTWTAEDGDVTYPFETDLETSRITISYAGDEGYAEILNGMRRCGTLLLVL